MPSRKRTVREKVMQAGGPPKIVEREIEEEYDASSTHEATPAKETNVMAIEEELLSRYPRPSLDELFRLAQQVEKDAAAEKKRSTSPEDTRKLADLVARQTEYLRKATND